MINKSFADYNLSKETKKSLQKHGYEVPTEIQDMTIPIALEGKDIIGQSQTGTGKTLAFSIPIINNIDRRKKKIQALIICPTRELSIQLSNEIKKFVKDNEVTTIYGGENIDKQIKSIKKGTNIIVGTPGRIIDHLKRKTLNLDNINYLVLDEADEMLNMGFIEDIEEIFKYIPYERQPMMFSATMPKEIVELSKRYLKDPENIKVEQKSLTVEKISQKYIKVKNIHKPEVLCRLIEMESAQKVIIFCNTKKMVDELNAEMQKRGFLSEGLHGDLKQQKREYIINRFKQNELSILIATDVAARGLDISDVELVFNYDIPQEQESYIHRIGRTGRAGKSGKTYTFVYGKDIDKLRNISKNIKANIDEEKIPTYLEVKNKKIEDFIEQIKESVNVGIDKEFYEIVNYFERNGLEIKDVLAFLLKDKFIDINSRDINLSEYTQNKSEKKNKSKISKNKTRIHINLGKKDKIDKLDIIKTFEKEWGIPRGQITNVDMFDKFSFFNVPNKYVKNLKNRIKIKGKRTKPAISK